MVETKKLTRSAILIAVGIVVPFIFHNFGLPGNVFLPMHFSPLIAGFLVGPLYAAGVGAILPLLNFAISGMPPMPMAALMMVELAIFGLVTALLDQKLDWGLLPSLIIAILAGRVVYHFLQVVIVMEFTNPLPLIAGGIATGLPGIIGQLVLVPIIVWAIREARN